MKMPSCFLAAVCSGALAFAGCTSTGAKRPLDTTKYDQENRLNAVLLDADTQRWITFSGLQEKRDENGRLREVAVNVRNRVNRPRHVQINCEFKDAQGFAIDSTPFENLLLTENEQKTVRFAAISDKTTGYTVRIRKAR
jgi:hypothetical protein